MPHRRISDRTPYKLIEKCIFDQRYLLLAAYGAFGITLASFIVRSSWNTLKHGLEIWQHGDGNIILGILEGLDNIMIANVAYLICAGSYLVYVRGRADNMSFDSTKDKPLALQNLTGTTLKEKMAASLVGVSSINLLAIMLDTGVLTGDDKVNEVDWFIVGLKVGIHLVFLLGLYVFMKVASHEHPSHEAKPAESKTGEGHAVPDIHAA